MRVCERNGQKAVMSSPFVLTGFGVYLDSHSKLNVRFCYVPFNIQTSTLSSVNHIEPTWKVWF